MDTIFLFEFYNFSRNLCRFYIAKFSLFTAPKICRFKATDYTRLKELNIPVWQFYDVKRKYLEKSSNQKESIEGDFIQLTDSGTYIPNPIKPSRNKKQSRLEPESSIMNIELSLPNGAVVRIQGSINAVSLNTIITAAQNNV